MDAVLLPTPCGPVGYCSGVKGRSRVAVGRLHMDGLGWNSSRARVGRAVQGWIGSRWPRGFCGCLVSLVVVYGKGVQRRVERFVYSALHRLRARISPLDINLSHSWKQSNTHPPAHRSGFEDSYVCFELHVVSLFASSSFWWTQSSVNSISILAAHMSTAFSSRAVGGPGDWYVEKNASAICTCQYTIAVFHSLVLLLPDIFRHQNCKCHPMQC